MEFQHVYKDGSFGLRLGVRVSGNRVPANYSERNPGVFEHRDDGSFLIRVDLPGTVLSVKTFEEEEAGD
jgi:hypothetical protein